MALRRLLLIAACLAPACLASLAAAADDVPRPTVADGQKAFDSGQFDQAQQVWSALAANGDPDTVAQAAFRLGILYDVGSGVATDPVAAFRWYLVAAELGLPAAEFNVAVMNDSGVGGPRNLDEAATWYARAAAHGHLRAQYNLARLYDAGEGVPRNKYVAAAWLRAAAGKKLGEAAIELGHARQVRPPAPQTGGQRTRLEPPTLVVPAEGETLHRSGQGGRAAEFVWTPPAPAAPIRFFLEVTADGAQATAVFADYLDLTARLVRLPAPGHYSWRVYAVGEAGGKADYAVSPWRSFAQD